MDKKFKIALYVILGIIGSFISCYGASQTNPHVYYVIGASCMLITAIYFQYTYFIALELILIAGHGSVLLGFGSTLQIVLPVLMCLQLLVYYLLMGQLNNIFLVAGIIGIALLSIAFSHENQWMFFAGSLGISIFASNQVYHKSYAALLWATLNIIFVYIAFLHIINT